MDRITLLAGSGKKDECIDMKLLSIRHLYDYTYIYTATGYWIKTYKKFSDINKYYNMNAIVDALAYFMSLHTMLLKLY